MPVDQQAQAIAQLLQAIMSGQPNQQGMGQQQAPPNGLQGPLQGGGQQGMQGMGSPMLGMGGGGPLPLPPMPDTNQQGLPQSPIDPFGGGMGAAMGGG